MAAENSAKQDAFHSACSFGRLKVRWRQTSRRLESETRPERHGSDLDTTRGVTRCFREVIGGRIFVCAPLVDLHRDAMHDASRAKRVSAGNVCRAQEGATEGVQQPSQRDDLAEPV